MYRYKSTLFDKLLLNPSYNRLFNYYDKKLRAINGLKMLRKGILHRKKPPGTELTRRLFYVFYHFKTRSVCSLKGGTSIFTLSPF